MTDDFPGVHPSGFTGGTIKRVVVDVSGEAYVDFEMEALAARNATSPGPYPVVPIQQETRLG